MKYVRFLLTGLSVLTLLSMAVAPSALAAKPSNNDSNAWLLWQQQHGGGQSKSSGNTANISQNVVKPQNNVVHTPVVPLNNVKPQDNAVHTPTITQNFVKPGTLDPKGSGSPTVTQNLLVKPGTITQNNIIVKPGTLTTNSRVTLNTSKTPLTNQKLGAALKAMNTSATQTQVSALAKALQTKDLKAPVIKDLNLTNADITALLALVSADVTAGDTSAQITTDIAKLLNSFGNQSSNKVNNEEDENNSDEDNDENNESSPAPVLVYPYSYIPGYSYSFIGATSAMYVDGFGPVAVESVQLSNGQTVQIPAPPYNQSMVWGSFGTYANWVAQFQAQNGRVPTDQDAVNFWISQALAGQLRISPTP
jgi:hypothetical protein